METNLMYLIEYKSMEGEDLGIEVEFTGQLRVENDGIGAYEFWGARGYDSGHDYFVCEDILWDKEMHTSEENELIEEYLTLNFKEIENCIIEKLNEEIYNL